MNKIFLVWVLIITPIMGGIGSVLSYYLFDIPAIIAMPVGIACVLVPIIIGFRWAVLSIQKGSPCEHCGTKWAHKYGCPEYEEVDG